MYPSSSSSSSQGYMGPTSSGLIRYRSAPGSLLATAVDSVVGPNPEFSAIGSQSQNLVGPASYLASETSSVTSSNMMSTREPNVIELQRSLQFDCGGDSSLIRHSSLPAGFLNHLGTAVSADNGFSITRPIGSYDSKGASDSRHGISRLNSQLSFTGQNSLSQITEDSETVINGMGTDNCHEKAAHFYATSSFGMGSWDNTDAIMFSSPPRKRAKNISSGHVNGGNTIDSQFQFSMPQKSPEMATVESLLQIPQDSVPCKISAKRGFATHPRSIAERERRTRISGKLKKLQDLVPNMDKQTSYADMLDLAVQHIRGLQNHVQNLNQELENCTCGCKQSR